MVEITLYIYIYLRKAIQTSSVGRQQKNSMEHGLFVCSIHIAMENWKNFNGKYHFSAKLLSNKLSNYYSNAYKKHWNNSWTICILNVILLTWDIILYIGLTEIHIFFLT